MKEAPPNPSYTDRIRSWAKTKAHGGAQRHSKRSEPTVLPLNHQKTISSTHSHPVVATPSSIHHNAALGSASGARSGSGDGASGLAASGDNSAPGDGSKPPPSSLPQPSGEGAIMNPEDGQDETRKNVAVRFMLTVKQILLYNKFINSLLVFVPIGIVVAEIPGMPPAIIFAMNAIAIIPLAGLLSYATEGVARKLGDSLGALLNITFGNAVELIIL